MSINVMVDIETFGTGRKAVPISIGAVKFDGKQIYDRFHVGIDPKSAQACGLEISADTVVWWLDDERREAWRAWQRLEKESLPIALDGFARWVGAPLDNFAQGQRLLNNDTSPAEVTALWGNGATFDNMILRDAYDACAMDYPVSPFQDMCYRTIKTRAPQVKLQRIGVHHSAVDDAESQARHLQDLAGALGFEL